MCGEYAYMKQFVTRESVSEWPANKAFQQNIVLFSNVFKFREEFLFCFPGTSAATKRVFSLMNSA